MERDVREKHFQICFSSNGVCERYCWVDVRPRNSAKEKDDKRNRRSKRESDDEEGLERSNALGKGDGGNGSGSNENEHVGA